MVEVNDSVVSPDGALKVTLTAFDPRNGQGRVKIEELKAERGRFYVTVEYGEAVRPEKAVRTPLYHQPE